MTTGTVSAQAGDTVRPASRAARLLALVLVALIGVPLGFWLAYQLRQPQVSLSTGATAFRLQVRNRDIVTARRTGTIKLTRNSVEGQVSASIHYYPTNRQFDLLGRFDLNKRAWFHDCLPKVQFMGSPEVRVPGAVVEQRYQERCGQPLHGVLRLIVLKDGDAIMFDVYTDGASTDQSDLGERSWESILPYERELESRLRPSIL
jgi:hypothetical protein